LTKEFAVSTTITAQPGTPFIDIEREFNAPPALVHRAWTEADLVAQWLHPRNLKMGVFDYDARDGGGYRYVHIDNDGQEYVFRGVFHTVSPERIIQTFEFAGWPGQVSIETTTFEDLGDGRTRVRSHAVYPSVEARDGMVESGMERGVRDSYEQLDELLDDQS
jgi:uncharacterized protein YndB with AHSA1/START domain